MDAKGEDHSFQHVLQDRQLCPVTISNATVAIWAERAELLHDHHHTVEDDGSISTLSLTIDDVTVELNRLLGSMKVTADETASSPSSQPRCVLNIHVASYS